MKVGIIGLGLIGASFAKTLHAKNAATVFGTDISDEVMQKARLANIIDYPLTQQNASQLDMLVVALYPRVFRSAVLPFLPLLKEGTVVTDFCGIKRSVLSDMHDLAQTYPNLFFVGGHPMAGIEYSGIGHSLANLFDDASMILVPCSQQIDKLEKLKNFYLFLGFGEVVYCSAEHHDSMIAYTSQLCHVVSNAFIKNDSAANHTGYSAGSYKDLTRVAQMNSRMWAELMTDNREKLSAELDEFIANLQKYSAALKSGDEAQLYDLLEQGNLRKLQIDSGKDSK